MMLAVHAPSASMVMPRKHADERVTGDPVGFAILGTGIIADVHRQAIAMNADLGARLVAVGHYDPSRFAEIGERFEAPCLSEAGLLKCPEVDVVCLATLSATSTAPPGFRQRVEVYGTAGAILLEGDAAIRWETANGPGAGTSTPAGTAASGVAAAASPFPTVGSQSPVAHAAFVRDFVKALRDRRPPSVDGREGQRSLAAVLGIYEAAGLLSRSDCIAG